MLKGGQLAKAEKAREEDVQSDGFFCVERNGVRPSLLQIAQRVMEMIIF